MTNQSTTEGERDIVDDLKAEIPAWPFIGKIMQRGMDEIQSLRAQLAEAEEKNAALWENTSTRLETITLQTKVIGDLKLQLAEKEKELAESHNDWKETEAAYKGVNKAHNEKIARISELEQQLEAVRKQTVDECQRVALKAEDRIGPATLALRLMLIDISAVEEK